MIEATNPFSQCGASKPTSRSEQKLHDILKAGRSAFLEHGFDAVTMDRIAEVANVSKRTVYSHFQSKETLFAAVMGAVCASYRETMLYGIACDAPIEQALSQFGHGFLSMLFNPENVAMYRILAAKAETFPEIGEQFCNAGLRPTTQTLADYLAAQAEAGVIEVDDPYEAASSFIGSLQGKCHTEVLLTQAGYPDAERIERIVAGAVHRFLYGVATTRPAGTAGGG